RLRARPRGSSRGSASRHGWKRRLAAPIAVLPSARQAHGGENEAGHGIGLREIAPQLPVDRMNVLGQKPVAISVSQCVDKQVSSLVTASNRPPGIDQPEAAN